MLKRRHFLSAIGLAVFLSTAPVAIFAENAPVFDADSMPSLEAGETGESGVDQNQDLPPPPAPGQEAAAAKAYSVERSSVDQRLKRMEQRLNSSESSVVSAQVESLQHQVQTLRGEVEQLTHQLQQLQTQQQAQQAQQKKFYADVDLRLSKSTVSQDQTLGMKPDTKPEKTETTKNKKPKAEQPAAEAAQPAVANTGLTEKTEQTTNTPEEQQLYQKAYDSIKAKNYPEAVNILQTMLKKYPSGQFTSNAHYWLGELYGLMGKNDQALTEFQTVVNTYSNSFRVPDAMLKVGLIYAAQLNWADSKAAFKKVIRRYPNTASARLAAEQLKQIKDAGN